MGVLSAPTNFLAHKFRNSDSKILGLTILSMTNGRSLVDVLNGDTGSVLFWVRGILGQGHSGLVSDIPYGYWVALLV